MIADDQLPKRFRDVVQDQVDIFGKRRTFERRNAIPDTPDIPLDDERHWLRIPGVTCVFVDMIASTQLSAEHQEADTAGAFQLFTGTAVRLFDKFDAPYIDVRGDGVFALFDSDHPYSALAAAVSFKTFSKEDFVPRMKAITDVGLGTHIGIDSSTVLVRRIGMRRYAQRTDRQNEVWAGKPVSMAAKLASLSADDELLVSPRFYDQITDDVARLSCGCGHDRQERTPLWHSVDVTSHVHFDFNEAWCLGSQWCRVHGREFCEDMLALDPS